jgi:hypothetical protein
MTKTSNRYRSAISLACIAVALNLAACAPVDDTSAPPDKITISAAKPVNTIRYLDNLYFPAALACGRAYTYWDFDCRPTVYIKELPQLRQPGQYVFQATGAFVKISLKVTQWYPFGIQDKLRKHEEAHYKMCLHLYAKGTIAAREAAQSVVGKKITSSAGNLETAKDAAELELQRSIEADYRHNIAEQADVQGVIFDRITNHGMNDVNEKKGIKQALEEYEQQATASAESHQKQYQKDEPTAENSIVDSNPEPHKVEPK